MDAIFNTLEQWLIAIDAWHLWVLAAILLAIAELIGSQFVLFALGTSCLAGAAVAAWTPWGINAQIVASLIAAAVLTPSFVFAFRQRRKAQRGPLDEGWESGQQAVLERYAGRVGVRIRGDFFPARTVSGALPEVGSLVTVVRIEGITACVVPVATSDPAQQPMTKEQGP